MGRPKKRKNCGTKDGNEPARNKVARGGDWACPICGTLNYARKKACFNKRCKYKIPVLQEGSASTSTDLPTTTPKIPVVTVYKDVRPGDWSCGECSGFNFQRRKTCKDCGRVKEFDLKPATEGGRASPPPTLMPIYFKEDGSPATPEDVERLAAVREKNNIQPPEPVAEAEGPKHIKAAHPSDNITDMVREVNGWPVFPTVVDRYYTQFFYHFCKQSRSEQKRLLKLVLKC